MPPRPEQPRVGLADRQVMVRPRREPRLAERAVGRLGADDPGPDEVSEQYRRQFPGPPGGRVDIDDHL
jgi:hypothetical protein